MRARDCRRKARRALKGKWVRTAALLLLAGAVLGVLALIISIAAMGPLMVSVFKGLDRMVYGAEAATSELVQIPAAFFVIVTVGSLIACVVQSLLVVGMSKVGRAVLRGENPGPRLLFPLELLGKAVAMNLVRAALVGVQLMLLIAPGVVAMYRYSMADYLLAAHPELGPIEALRKSAKRMKGRKVALFQLQIRFIGWAALCVLPGFLISLWTNFSLLGAVRMTLGSYALSIAATLLGAGGGLFVGAYALTAITAFFRGADKPAKKRKVQAK